MNEKIFEFKNNNIEVRKNVESFLNLPERISETNEDKNLPKNLGDFLVNEGFIKGVDLWKGSWGFKYNSVDKKISIAEKEMSKENYEYYIFRLGKDQNGESLFPKQGDETNQYRFLHETSHAYQDYLVNKESSENNFDSLSWYNKAVEEKQDSTFSMLFKLCFEIRKANENKGLSTWGNVPDYENIDVKNNRVAVKALEDANELVVMQLWHPKYLDTFLDYLALKNNGYDETSLEKDKLSKISPNTRQILKEIIELYIEEMKINLKKK
ncbi:MAG: hypothetical protein WCG45_01460 [bacterium]